MGENVVAIFRRLVTGKARLVESPVPRLAVLKVSEAPTPRRGVLFGIFNHELGNKTIRFIW